MLEDFPFAAFVSKTVTVAPRGGNPPPRLWELPAGLLDSIGLPNKGLRGYLAEDLPALAELPVPLIVNVMGSSPRRGRRRLVAAFAERDEVAALELNVSCPNVKTGLLMGADPVETGGAARRGAASDRQAADRQAHAERRRRRRRSRRRPRRTGADAVSLINTLRGMAMDPRGRGARGSAAARAACPGRRCAPSRSRRCARSARASIPIVGMGGVQSADTPPTCWRRAPTIVGVGTETSAIRSPAGGSRTSWRDLPHRPRGSAAARGAPLA